MGFADGATILSSAVGWLNTPTSLFDGYSTLQFLEALVYFSFMGMVIGRVMRGKAYHHGSENEEKLTEGEGKNYEPREEVNLTLDDIETQAPYEDWT